MKSFKSDHWNIFDQDFFDLLKSPQGLTQFRINGLSCYLETGMLGKDRSHMIKNRLLYDQEYNDEERHDVLERYKELCRMVGDESWVRDRMACWVGQPRHMKYSGVMLNVDDLFHAYATWQINRMCDSHAINTIIEIGGGYGNLAHKIMTTLGDVQRYVILDLPETIEIQYYYLKSLFPDKKIIKGCPSPHEPFDFALVPGWEMQQLTDWIKPDLIINMRSFGEMPPPVMKSYFDWIQEISHTGTFFYTVNRYVFTIHDSKLKDYPFDDRWDVLVSQPQWLQTHLHEFMLRRAESPVIGRPTLPYCLRSFPERTPPPGPQLPASILSAKDWAAFNKLRRRIQVIFPMAGDGKRFGGCFKPFLQATDVTFIELAKLPFDELKSSFDVHYYFVIRKDQEISHHVKSRLEKMFLGDCIHVIELDQTTTSGPCETVMRAVHRERLMGLTMVCDCDHSIDIRPLKEAMEKDDDADVDAWIPVWPISKEEFHRWGKVLTSSDMNVLSFCEKEDPNTTDVQVWGRIGCYGFRDIEAWAAENWHADFTDLFKAHKKVYKCVTIEHASFFGEPETLEQFRHRRNKCMTLFIDIDGTLIEQQPVQSYDPHANALLPGSVETLTRWKNDGHHIVLVTARNEKYRNDMGMLLRNLGLLYDQLIMGVGSGPRILINDSKPYNPFMMMARGIQVRRNEGLLHVDYWGNETHDDERILTTLAGASKASVFVVTDCKDRSVVRKHVHKTKDSLDAYHCLKRQCEDLRRFRFLIPEYVPNVLEEKDRECDYFYDLEYYPDHVPLSQVEIEDAPRHLHKLLGVLTEHVYVMQKPVSGQVWWQEFMREKLEPKLAWLASQSVAISNLVNEDHLIINNAPCRGLRYLLHQHPMRNDVLPTCVQPIHGDLTFENIICNPATGSVKLIDNDGSRYLDAIGLEIGKLFQSTVSSYHLWKDTPPKVHNDDLIFTTVFQERNDPMCDIIVQAYSPYVKDPWMVGLFYLGTWLLRMSPFMKLKSYEHLLFATVSACYYLNKVLSQ